MYTNKTHPNAWTEVWTVKLVGSTFKASNGCSRQAALKRAAKMQDDFESFDTELERYEYEGSPAYHVLFDDREVGNVPADVASELAAMEDSGYTVFCDSCWIYGGPTDDEPDHHYGAELKIVVRRKQTDAERQAALYDLARKAKQQEQTRAAAAASIPPAPTQPSPAPKRRPDEFPRLGVTHCRSCGAEFPCSDDRCPRCGYSTVNYVRDQANVEPYAPEISENRTRRKSKWKTVLIVLGVLWLFGLAPQIISAIIGARDFKNSPPEMQASAEAVSERLASDDSAVSSASTQESSPSPSVEAFVPPAPITYTGNGDDYFDIFPFDSLYYFRITGNSDARHFSVTGYDAAGNYTELFVNTTDYYTGFVLDPNQDTRTLEVDAEGAWTIEIISLYTAPTLSVGETYSGIDDAVLLIPSGCRSAVVNGNTLSRHFSIVTYGSGYDLLVNTVDPYSGTVRIDSGATVMSVNAVGGWSITPQ